MEISKVNAIIRTMALGRVEERLEKLGVSGLSVSRVAGRGEYANYFAREHRTPHVRIEVFAERGRAEKIARAIADAAHTGTPGDGIVAILPVQRVLRVRTLRDADVDELS